MKAIIHAKAVTPGGIIPNATLLLDAGNIQAIGTDLPVPADAEVIDAAGMWVGPGFVDIHVHGDGTDGRWESNPAKAAAHHLKHGTTTMVATLAYTLQKQELLETAKNIQSMLDAGQLRYNSSRRDVSGNIMFSYSKIFKPAKAARPGVNQALSLWK